ncbi:MAG: 1-acyl-sn-glycerol-3-phosphate acyltransferase [Bacteroidaceae bacterium]|nr:1-acyl-sn-glycerol-3-phosphate acyltransferase [Bacteroidaceae bacterium]
MANGADGSLEINLHEVIRNRMGSKARFVPDFLIKWLERTIHQDYINQFLRKGYEGVEFCEECIKELGATVTHEGIESLPTDGRRFTFVSNHPLGAVDGITLGALLGRHYDGHIRYLVNDLLMNIKGLAPLCIPINKLGKQSRNLPRQINEAFNSDNQIIMFPAGLCSRRINGEIRDIPWGKAFIKRSVQSKRDIIPVHFIGENSQRFYRIATWCKRLHIKFNIAMLFLPDEMVKTRGQKYHVVFGNPIPWQTFDSRRTPAEWALWVEDKVYKLQSNARV